MMKVLSHSVVSDSATPWIIACQAPLFMTFPRQEYWREKKKRERERETEREYCGGKKKNTRVGWHFLLQGIFLTQGLNQRLLNCRQILHCLSQDV